MGCPGELSRTRRWVEVVVGHQLPLLIENALNAVRVAVPGSNADSPE
jgi:hypothetical protein